MANRNLIMIRNISHLTDARYFAAMEVDWISITLTDDATSFSKWHAMRDWITGVKLAAELSSEEESLVAKTIIDASPDGIITDNLDIIHLTGGIDLFVLTEKLLHANDNFYQIISYDKLKSTNDIATLSSRTNIFLAADWTPALIKEMKENNYAGGFCFHASGEMATGMKDFSGMDEMLEIARGDPDS